MSKRRFSFWESYYSALKKIKSDADKGRFVCGICQRVFDGTEPDFSDDPVLDALYTIISDQVEESVTLFERASEGGRKSAQKRRSKRGAQKVEGGSEGGSEGGCEGGSQGGSERIVRYSKVPYTASDAPLGERPPQYSREELIAAGVVPVVERPVC